MYPLSLLASGMVTGIGFNASASCAAIRVGFDNFEETRFVDQEGEWIIGCQVQVKSSLRGAKKLLHMIVSAIRECLIDFAHIRSEQIPLFLCVAESERPGRISGLDTSFFQRIENELGLRFHHESRFIEAGHIGGILAIQKARELIYEENVPICIVAGVDSFLVSETLRSYEERNRLKTTNNSNGFIPGEAGAAVVLGRSNFENEADLYCLGIGFGKEKATIDSDGPFRADGLLAAYEAVFEDSSATIDDVDFRITSANGEQYHFKEASLVASRTIRNLKPEFDIWHPADCVGEIGAAIVPCVLGVAMAGAKKKYLAGKGILCHFGNDNGERAAIILRSR